MKWLAAAVITLLLFLAYALAIRISTKRETRYYKERVREERQIAYQLYNSIPTALKTSGGGRKLEDPKEQVLLRDAVRNSTCTNSLLH